MKELASCYHILSCRLNCLRKSVYKQQMWFGDWLKPDIDNCTEWIKPKTIAIFGESIKDVKQVEPTGAIHKGLRGLLERI